MLVDLTLGSESPVVSRQEQPSSGNDAASAECGRRNRVATLVARADKESEHGAVAPSAAATAMIVSAFRTGTTIV